MDRRCLKFADFDESHFLMFHIYAHLYIPVFCVPYLRVSI